MIGVSQAEVAPLAAVGEQLIKVNGLYSGQAAKRVFTVT
jgi:hypothetical protein